MLDVAGPIQDILALASVCGAGIQVGFLQGMLPSDVGGVDPGPAEVRRAVTLAMEQGALGIKILGGHHPFTPSATARIIAEANQQRTYVAIHCGTTETPGDLAGLAETIALKETNRLHVAYINSYCMGAIPPPFEETRRAMAIVEATPGLITNPTSHGSMALGERVLTASRRVRGRGPRCNDVDLLRPRTV